MSDINATPAIANGAVLQAQGLSKRFSEGGLDVQVLRGIDLQVDAGETVAIVGASGSGKSTLLHLLGGLDVPDRGELSVCGLDPRNETARLELRRRHLGFVFQLHNLIPDLSMEENIAVPALATGVPAAARRARIRALAEQLGLAHRLGHRIQDLSGGERQRTALARAILKQPAVILADEPTGNLDPENAAAVFRHLAAYQQRGGTVMVVTHGQDAAPHACRTFRLEQGRLTEPQTQPVSR